MSGPGDGRAARPAGRDRLRASHADREQVIDTLKDAFVQGRLTKDEFDSRVADVLASRTYAELAALTADLPAGPPAAKRPRQPIPARPRRPETRPENRTVRNGALVIAATTVLAGSAWAGALLSQTDNQVVGALVMSLTFLWFGMVLIIGAIMLQSRLEQRSGTQPPPARGQDDRGAKRAVPADPPGQLRPGDRRGGYAAEASRSPLPRPPMLLRSRLSPS